MAVGRTVIGPVRRGRGFSRMVAAMVLAVAAIPLLAVQPAHAGVGLAVVPDFPTNVTPGQTDVPASISITNLSSGAQAVGNITLSGITLVPSCSNFNAGCAAGTADPGTFEVSATAVGVAGSACAGMVFSVTVVSAAT